MQVSIRLTDHLRDKSQQIDQKRGSENVAIHLMAAAATALEGSDYKNIRIQDLCNSVGISRATFYLHYSSKDELFGDITRQLSELEMTLMPSLADEPDPWLGLLWMLEWRTQFLFENLHLIEAGAYLSDSSKSVNEVWYKAGNRRRGRFVNELMRYEPFRESGEDLLHMTLDVVGRGHNGLMYSLFGRNSGWSTETNSMTLEEIPEFFARLIYRSLLARDPDDIRVKGPALKSKETKSPGKIQR